MSELFDEVCVNLSMLLSLLLLFLSESIVGVHIAIAVYTSEDGPEYDKDRNPSAIMESLNWDSAYFTMKYIYFILLGKFGFVLFDCFKHISVDKLAVNLH